WGARRNDSVRWRSSRRSAVPGGPGQSRAVAALFAVSSNDAQAVVVLVRAVGGGRVARLWDAPGGAVDVSRGESPTRPLVASRPRTARLSRRSLNRRGA